MGKRRAGPAGDGLPSSDGRVTMKTVAEAAGVHISTVSRILSRTATDGASGRSKAAERVLAVADRLGYVPNPAAASLRSQRTRVIGVVVPRLTDVVVATIFEGIAAEAASLGYQAVVATSDDDPRKQRERIRALIARRVDGIIIGDAHLDDTLADELVRVGVPHLFAVRRAPHASAITSDDAEGGGLVGTHLADLGHRRIGVIAGHRWASTGLDRAEGFLEVLRARGIDVPVEHVLYEGFDVAAGRRAAETLLQPDKAITAIFAVNDYAALGVMGAAREKGLRVGHDIAVAGYNDIDIARELPVPLTSVRNPVREMGALAAQCLIDMLNDRPRRTQEKLVPRLVVRESTAPTGATGGSSGR
jgi:LacI family transcriptional regulator